MEYFLFAAWTMTVGFSFYFVGYNRSYNDITGLLRDSRKDETKFKFVVDKLIEGNDE